AWRSLHSFDPQHTSYKSAHAAVRLMPTSYPATPHQAAARMEFSHIAQLHLAALFSFCAAYHGIYSSWFSSATCQCNEALLRYECYESSGSSVPASLQPHHAHFVNSCKQYGITAIYNAPARQLLLPDSL